MCHHTSKRSLRQSRYCKVYLLTICQQGQKTVDKVFAIYLELNQIMCEGSFNFRIWNSNSEEFIEHICEIMGGNENTIGPDSKVNEEDHMLYVKISGLYWDTNSEEIRFNFKEIT